MAREGRPYPVPAELHDYSGDWREKHDAFWKDLEAKHVTIRFQVADGYAVYVVESLKPLVLRHVDYMDGYRIPAAHLRGLRASDVRRMVEGERAMRKLFARKEADHA